MFSLINLQKLVAACLAPEDKLHEVAVTPELGSRSFPWGLSLCPGGSKQRGAEYIIAHLCALLPGTSGHPHIPFLGLFAAIPSSFWPQVDSLKSCVLVAPCRHIRSCSAVAARVSFSKMMADACSIPYSCRGKSALHLRACEIHRTADISAPI